ncbi:hypothetical protein RDABS01_034713 [Bienertia sinuspersici]
MAKLLSLLSLSLLFLFSLSSANPNPNSLLSAHKELETFGFPIGLLPTNVAHYSINRTSGEFSVKLSDKCKLTLPPDNYLATYSKIVRGKIVKNKIAELDGIKVRAMFQWWSITGIRSSGDNLVFEVGMLSAKYPAKNFDASPPCEGLKADS